MGVLPRLAFATFLAGFLPFSARAAESMIRIDGGRFDAIRPHDGAFEGGVQYQAQASPWHPHAIAGAMVTTKAAFNAYVGVGVDLPVGERLLVRPSFSPGVYHHGSGTDLGNALEFRSGIEVGCRIAEGQRLGVELYHLSNAGLGRRNPGEESIVVTYAVGLAKLRSKR